MRFRTKGVRRGNELVPGLTIANFPLNYCPGWQIKASGIRMNEIQSELIGVYDNSTVLVDYLMCSQIPVINNYYSWTWETPSILRESASTLYYVPRQNKQLLSGYFARLNKSGTTSGSCDFETQQMCGWLQDADDDGDWIRNNLGTASVNTGPKSDHTTHADDLSK